MTFCAGKEETLARTLWGGFVESGDLMARVSLDDQFPIHRALDGASDAAFRLHTSAIFWCARNSTGGFVPEEDLGLVSARVRTPARFAAELVERGLWQAVTGGWQIIDDSVRLRSRREKEELSAKRRAAGRTGGVRSGESRNEATTKQTRSKLLPASTDPNGEKPQVTTGAEANAKQVASSPPSPRTPHPPTGGVRPRPRVRGARTRDGGPTPPRADGVDVAEALRSPRDGCPHEDPRGPAYCPLCRRGIPPTQEQDHDRRSE